MPQPRRRPDEPEHRGRVTVSSTHQERRALELAGEVLELRQLCADLGDRNTRLEQENRALRERIDLVGAHLRGFLESLGCRSFEEAKALLDRYAAGGPDIDLEALLARERRLREGR